jgi:hypothetical protein
LADFNWYRVSTTDDPVTQGDIIRDCPVANLITTEKYPFIKPVGLAIDAIVLTQACDLANVKANMKEVTVCRLVPIQTVVKMLMEQTFKDKQGFDYSNLSAKERERQKRIVDDLRKGKYLDYYLLNMFVDDTGEGLDAQYQVVSLRDTFQVPVESIRKIVLYKGGKRLSLLPPYREHLAQAYTFNFSRIGLPIDIEVDLEQI